MNGSKILRMAFSEVAPPKHYWRLRPIHVVYIVILFAEMGVLWFGFHSVETFEARVYSLRERYLNEVSHALEGPIAALASKGSLDPETLSYVFSSFETFQRPTQEDATSDEQLILHLLMTDLSGTVLYDSKGKANGSLLISRPEVIAALQGHSVRRDEYHADGVMVMHVGSPIRRDGKVIGTLVASKSNLRLNPLVLVVEDGMGLVMLAMGLLVLLLLLSAYLLLYRPIELWLTRIDIARGGSPTLRPNLRRKRYGRIGLLLDRIHETISEKRHMEQLVACHAHEMKNPISAIRMHLELLARTSDPDKKDQLIEHIMAASQRMADVTERLLIIAAMERREALKELVPTRIEELLEVMIKRLSEEAKPLGIQLSLEAPQNLEVRCEPILLEMAISNLVQNAIDHSPPETSVEVTLIIKDAILECHVRDHGNGIPDHAVHHIFDKYFTLPKYATGKPGTGIGLNVVQQVADLHDGGIALTNHPEGGVLAVFSLPI